MDDHHFNILFKWWFIENTRPEVTQKKILKSKGAWPQTLILLYLIFFLL